MAEIFLQKDGINLLKGKKILLLGDSNVRGLYKDLIWLLKCNSLIDAGFLRRRVSKPEQNFLGDRVTFESELNRGRDFKEKRCFQHAGVEVEFVFLTRCYSTQVEEIFNGIKDGKRPTPDVIYMNSCLWDICRWGPNGVKEYKQNLVKLMKLAKDTLPKRTLFMWGTTLPVASTTSGGLIIKQIEFLQAALRVHVVEANSYATSLVSSYGFDIIDFHYFMHYQICRRSADGIHFMPHAVRFMTNLLLTHIALSWDVPLPPRVSRQPGPLQKLLQLASGNQSGEGVQQGAKVQEMEKLASVVTKKEEVSKPGPSRKNKRPSRPLYKGKQTIGQQEFITKMPSYHDGYSEGNFARDDYNAFPNALYNAGDAISRAQSVLEVVNQRLHNQHQVWDRNHMATQQVVWDNRYDWVTPDAHMYQYNHQYFQVGNAVQGYAQPNPTGGGAMRSHSSHSRPRQNPYSKRSRRDERHH